MAALLGNQSSKKSYTTDSRYIAVPYNTIPHKVHYRQVSNIRRTLVGNKIIDHSDVVGASPVGAAPTTS